MKGRRWITMLLLAALMLPLSLESASADTSGSRVRSFWFPAGDGTALAAGLCSWSWSKSANGTYSDLYTCRVKDMTGPNRGVSVRLAIKRDTEADWTSLPFTWVNGVTVAPTAKCAVNGSGVSKSCSRKRNTQAADMDLQISACITMNGACTSQVYVGAVFDR